DARALAETPPPRPAGAPRGPPPPGEGDDRDERPGRDRRMELHQLRHHQPEAGARRRHTRARPLQPLPGLAYRRARRATRSMERAPGRLIRVGLAYSTRTPRAHRGGVGGL